MKALDIHMGDAEMSEAKPIFQPTLQQPVIIATPTVPFDVRNYSPTQVPLVYILI
jgi:hypothetical protein